MDSRADGGGPSPTTDDAQTNLVIGVEPRRGLGAGHRQDLSEEAQVPLPDGGERNLRSQCGWCSGAGEGRARTRKPTSAGTAETRLGPFSVLPYASRPPRASPPDCCSTWSCQGSYPPLHRPSSLNPGPQKRPPRCPRRTQKRPAWRCDGSDGRRGEGWIGRARAQATRNPRAAGGRRVGPTAYRLVGNARTARSLARTARVAAWCTTQPP